MNTAPTGRAGRILHWLASHRKTITLDELHVMECRVMPGTTRAQIAATIAQLTDAGKAKRTGKRPHYRYSSTPKTLVDGRSKAKKSDRGYASPMARKPKAESQPVVVPKRERSKHFAPAKPRLTVANAAPETVEEFLARGGRIQYCKHGECGYSPSSYRERSQAHRERVSAEVIARHKASPRNAIDINDDETDDGLEAAA